MSAERLKPCPFCGTGNAGLYLLDDENGYYVYCTQCLLSGPEWTSKEAAYKHWNERHQGCVESHEGAAMAAFCTLIFQIMTRKRYSITPNI